jgi:predicted TPR repeat methyltransferase
VQYANEEFQCWKNHEFTKPGETNESAFAWAKQNQADAYAQVHQIQAQSQELREVDLQLMAEEQAKEQNTLVANALKAILKWERD